jgi:hypothetical protein
MRKLLSVPVLFLTLLTKAQTITNPGTGDSLYPVTNNTYQIPGGFNHKIYTEPTSIFNIAKAPGKYFLLGNFTNISENQGSALVVDTVANTIMNSQKWRINGIVYAAIPDGQGGFYIGGSFTNIGDSTRKYIAQITSTGQPTAFRPVADSFVKALYKRNDTLFIGGAFKNFAGKQRSCFAMYSTSGDTLCRNGGASGFTVMNNINAFVIQNDTLIYGGETYIVGSTNIKKYNFKDNISSSWALGFTNYGQVNHIQLSRDGSVLVFAGYYNGEYIKGVNNRLGNQQYFINVSMYWPENSNSGVVHGLKVAGDKAYVAGEFEHLLPSSGGTFFRKGFFVFDPMNGSIKNENLNLDWYSSFIDIKDEKIYLSGKFTTVNGVPREHFAVIDTGTLNISPRQFAPSDGLTALAFSGQYAFVAGVFSGINSVRRNGFAAIDSATHAVLPWNPVNAYIKEGRRMFVKGDSLFVFGWTSEGASTTCISRPYTALKIYSVATGVEYTVPTSLSTLYIDDCVVDGNYLYVAAEKKFQRYNLPSLTLDVGWGTSWIGAIGYEHNDNFLLVDNNRIFAFGDTRYVYICNGFGPKRAYMVEYSKTTGQYNHVYYYEGASNIYDQPRIEHALLTGDRIYVQGIFNQLNGNTRQNFACFNTNTGAVTNWQVSFPSTVTNQSIFGTTTRLQLYNGKIWLGSSAQTLSDGTLFHGFGGIDTLTGSLTTPVSFMHSNNFYFGHGVNDFILDDNELSFVGKFDTAGTRPFASFVRFKLNGAGSATSVQLCAGGTTTLTSNLSGTVYQWQVDAGTGFANLSNNSNYSGATTNILQINNAPVSFNGYQYRCVVDGANSTAFSLSVNAVPSTPTISASGSTTFCQGGTVTLTSSVAAGNQWYKDGLTISGAVGQTYSATQTGNYSVQASNGGCSAPVSAAVSVIVNATPPVTVSSTNTSICPGASTQITANGATTYTWSPATGLSGTTGNSVAASPTGTTTYTVTGTTSGCSLSQQITITVLAKPVLAVSPNDTAICAGTSVTMTAIGAVSYVWSPATGLSAVTGSSVVASPSVATTYTVTGTGSNGCTVSLSRTITLLPTVTPSVSITYSGCPSGSLAFTANVVNGGGGPTVQWYLNNVLSGTGTGYTLNNAVNGMQVYAKLTSLATCANPQIVNSATTTISCITTAVPDIDGVEAFEVAPNPTSGLVVVKLKLNGARKVAFEVADNVGKKVYEAGAVVLSGTVTKQIDLSAMTQGVYYLKTIINGKAVVEKIVVQR